MEAIVEIERSELDEAGQSWAVQANWEALAAHLAREHDGWFEELHGMVRFSTGLHSGFLNGVLRATLAPRAVKGALTLNRHVFGPDLPWRWIVGPHSTPDELDLTLERLGLERRWVGMTAMTLDLDGLDDRDWIPDGASVTEVTDRDELEAWLTVRQRNLELDEQTTDAWRTAHGRPGFGDDKPLRHFVGWLGENPVAATTLFLGAGAAGIYHVDTVEAARGHGFGKAVTTAALRAARELGFRWGVLQASTMGRPIYERLGFRPVGIYTVLIGGPVTR